MSRIETLGSERVTLAQHGAEVVVMHVSDPDYGRIATVRLSPEQAAALAGRMATMLLGDAPGQPRRPARG